MAKLEHTIPASEHYPERNSCIEVRVWGPGGRKDQPYYIGSGVNYQANDTIWIEFSYTVQGAQVFYTRSLLQCIDGLSDPDAFKKRLDEAIQAGEGIIGFGGMFPETCIQLKLDTHTYEEPGEEKQIYHNYRLEFSFDTGVVFRNGGPGQEALEFKLPYIEPEEATRFMLDLHTDFSDAYQGKHPDPGLTPPGRSEWPLIRQLNSPAYDIVSEDYDGDYFTNPLLEEVFNSWMMRLPAGGRVLDAGCGHGQPVIARLLERGFQAGGTDFSAAMLAKAQANFPQVPFLNKTTTELDFEGEFDGICSFHSALYLDPVDFFHSIYRFYHALKPGGLLFLFGYDSHPSWRGEPFGVVLNKWMWSNTYSMEEACKALEEHGYFDVLEARDITTEEEREQRRAEWQAEREKERQKDEERRKAWEKQQAETQTESQAPDRPVVDEERGSTPFESLPQTAQDFLKGLPSDENGNPDFSKLLPPLPEPKEELPYLYIVIAQRKNRD